ncbi:threonine ammonia-lyase [Isachenkonia alkalipeptolytica]|uniref:threonine ammonia-lyase n=1 Tax=Isachenkonia alkalipeptolytica TaxID=2565777 RepID=A0AA44BDI9_9CLOT|nr:threonine/serine dehydratase [Isachenkonia alkalipeptolytica]NBG88002.1 threonine/serine dehydratase [Isachenkonia alkalipeptolytica]
MITYHSVLAAKKRIEKGIYHTPLEHSMYLSHENRQVYLKLEAQQKLKSFKIRGALSKMMNLTEEEKQRGVITVSSGNHGSGVSYASAILKDVKATVVVPESTPESKVEKIRYYGARVIQKGENFDAANGYAKGLIEQEGLTYIDACSDEDVISGQGTMGLEILEDHRGMDTILVPIGGGGMITGISIAVKAINPNIKVIGVQTEACPAMDAAMKEGVFYEEYPTDPSICDALVGGVGRIPYELSKSAIDDIIVVSEKAIKKATKHLVTKEKVVSEPSGAVGVAALMEQGERIPGKEIAVVVSGGNLDERLLKKLLEG